MCEHWNLMDDPFAETHGGYLSIPGHEQAIARIVTAVSSHERRIVLEGESGVGKSVVVAEALRRLRDPRRRVSRSVAPLGGIGLMMDLTQDLGRRVPATSTRATAWRSLVDALRINRLQGLSTVLVIDAAETLVEPHDLADLHRLDVLGEVASTRIVILEVRRKSGDHEGYGDARSSRSIRLQPLTRSETEAYLSGCLKRAGSPGSLFASRAVTRLHALSAGLPRLLNRLASEALREAARRNAESIGTEIVECLAPSGAFAMPWA